MGYNYYVAGLLDLKKELVNRIDAEIILWTRGKANSNDLKEGLLYVIENDSSLNGRYKADEQTNCEGKK